MILSRIRLSRKRAIFFYYSITNQKIRICGEEATWDKRWFTFGTVIERYLCRIGTLCQDLTNLLLDLTRRQLVGIVATSMGKNVQFSSFAARKTRLALTTLDITFWEVKIRHLMHQNASRYTSFPSFYFQPSQWRLYLPHLQQKTPTAQCHFLNTDLIIYFFN